MTTKLEHITVRVKVHRHLGLTPEVKNVTYLHFLNKGIESDARADLGGVCRGCAKKQKNYVVYWC